MKEPRVREVIRNYENGNLKQVHEYLTQPDMIVDPSTWAGKVLKLIEDEHFVTAKQLIELTAYKFLK